MEHQSDEISDIDPSNECYDTTYPDAIQQSVDISTSPPIQSRLRTRNTSRPPSTMPTTRHREQPASKRARPVVFATNRPVQKEKSKATNEKYKAQKYTIQDLVRESEIEGIKVTPFVSCSSIGISMSLAKSHPVDRLLSYGPAQIQICPILHSFRSCRMVSCSSTYSIAYA
jgi:hypothetical protein